MLRDRLSSHWRLCFSCLFLSPLCLLLRWEAICAVRVACHSPKLQSNEWMDCCAIYGFAKQLRSLYIVIVSIRETDICLTRCRWINCVLLSLPPRREAFQPLAANCVEPSPS